MVKIIQKGNKILHTVAKDVAVEEIRSKKISKIISDMKKALAREPDGVAIAAPQIGIPLRIFVVSGKILKTLSGNELEKKDEVFINPKITRYSKEKKLVEEGCLSVRYMYGKVKRSAKISLEALDQKGDIIKKGASGLLAQIFQHETDHLEGVLFIDKAKEVEEITKEQWEEFTKRSKKDE